MRTGILGVRAALAELDRRRAADVEVWTRFGNAKLRREDGRLQIDGSAEAVEEAWRQYDENSQLTLFGGTTCRS